MLDIVISWTWIVFAILVVICTGLQVKISRIKSNTLATSNASFSRLQRIFFAPYFLSLFSDWLQGPYVYKLYSSYGFLASQIALLYVIGFASSAVFGTFTGILADRFGRRRITLAFCIIYTLCCLTKISPNFYVLLVGRIFGGIATSMLFSSFESWYVCEHNERHKFPPEWMAITFSRLTFWNGVLAIVAGVIANVFAETLDFGPVSPFLIAIPILLSAFFILGSTWEENYGNTKDHFTQSCIGSLKQIFSDKLILMLGIVVSLFESVMYMFIFVWTPILDADGKMPLGIVFASFMVCVMIGSAIPIIISSMVSSISHETILKLALGLGTASMLTCFVATRDVLNPAVNLAYAGFLLLEIAVGIYFPTVSYLRSQIIPESHRASIMNWFRLPMNVITCCGLLWLHNENNKNGNHQIFTVCLAMMSMALITSILFGRQLKKKPDKYEKSDTDDSSDVTNEPLLTST